MTARLTLEEYRRYRDDYVGYCTTCRDWTHDSAEPDAREYECPVCEQPTVYGAEEAFLLGTIVVV